MEFIKYFDTDVLPLLKEQSIKYYERDYCSPKEKLELIYSRLNREYEFYKNSYVEYAKKYDNILSMLEYYKEKMKFQYLYNCDEQIEFLEKDNMSDWQTIFELSDLNYMLEYVDFLFETVDDMKDYYEANEIKEIIKCYNENSLDIIDESKSKEIINNHFKMNNQINYADHEVISKILSSNPICNLIVFGTNYEKNSMSF